MPTGVLNHLAQTQGAAPVTPGHGHRKTWALLPRRVARLLRRSPKSRASYYDPLFERPDLIEDDYYRLRTQPRG